MRRTKIVCTLGPASNSRTEILRLAQAGMDVARLNFSHGRPEAHAEVASRVRDVSRSIGRPIGILQDLPGPKIRVGRVRDGRIHLKRGSIVGFVAEDVEGTPEVVSLPHPQVLEALRPGSDVYLADGALHVRVVSNHGGRVSARVLTEGDLGSNKGVNLPDVSVALPSALENDLRMFEYGIRMGVDWTAVSFVSSAVDVEPFREVARRMGSNVLLLAKIERKQALKQLEPIVLAFDGVLVARGDLGIETPIRDVPVVQKEIVKKCNSAGKPVVVATQMLVSMVNSPRPTRAESTDVANAILDGADAVMLSEETAVGRYASRCVSTMSSIAVSTERYLVSQWRRCGRSDHPSGSVTDAIALGAARLAEHVDAQALITCTTTGATARAVSKHRPTMPVLAAVSQPGAAGQLTLSWGVRPFEVAHRQGTDAMIQEGVEGALNARMVKYRDPVVIVAGVRAGVPGNSSLIKYHRVGDSIWE